PTPDLWRVKNAIDGSMTTGWKTQGVRGQFLRVSLGGASTVSVSDIFINPAATNGDTSDADLKDFGVRASVDGGTFNTILTSTATQEDSVQHFHLEAPVDARY